MHCASGRKYEEETRRNLAKRTEEHLSGEKSNHVNGVQVRPRIRARGILLRIVVVARPQWWNDIVFPRGTNSTIYLSRKQLGSKIFIALQKEEAEAKCKIDFRKKEGRESARWHPPPFYFLSRLFLGSAPALLFGILLVPTRNCDDKSVI